MTNFPDFLPHMRLGGPFLQLSLSQGETEAIMPLTDQLKSMLENTENMVELRVLVKIDQPPTETMKLYPDNIIVKSGDLVTKLNKPRWCKVDGCYMNEDPFNLGPHVTKYFHCTAMPLSVIILIMDDNRVSGVAEVFVSRKVKLTTLRRSIVQADPLPRALIERRKKNMRETGVEFEVVSLKCPCSGTQIRTPVRAETCRHPECFDLDNFLKMEEKKPKGRCPFCNHIIEFRQLGICELTSDLLKREPDCESYRIAPDGIRTLSSAEARQSRKRKREVLDQSAEIIDSPPHQPTGDDEPNDEPDVIVID